MNHTKHFQWFLLSFLLLGCSSKEKHSQENLVIEELKAQITVLEGRVEELERKVNRNTIQVSDLRYSSPDIEKATSASTEIPKSNPPPTNDFKSPFEETRYTTLDEQTILFDADVRLSVGRYSSVYSPNGELFMTKDEEGYFIWGSLVVEDSSTGGKLEHIGTILIDENGRFTRMLIDDSQLLKDVDKN